MLRELGDEHLVIHGEGDDLACLVLGVDELQDADHLIFPCLQGHAQDGAGTVVRLLVEGGVEGKGQVTLDVIHVVDQDGLTGLGDVAGKGGLVDGQRGAAGDVLVLGFPPEERVVLHEAEVQEAAGGKIDRSRIRHEETARLREDVLKQ
jgi:hypothetical protein